MKTLRAWIACTVFALAVPAFAWEVLPASAPVPQDNPMSDAKIELGKKLYFDKRLSKTGEVSCNSCHSVTGSGTDNQPVSTGINGLKGKRNAPTVWNAAFWSVQFWDGRAKTLEDQAKGPMINPVEMGNSDHAEVIARISKFSGYQKEFKEVFVGTDPLTIDHVAAAIAAYERTLITPDSAYDLYLKGDKKALTPAAARGMTLVKKIGCTACHTGPHFSGPMVAGGFFMKFPLIPGSEYEKKYELTKDLGRYENTKKDADKGFWRVPSWRNVELTGPYFHNGKVKTLDEAVRVMAKTQLNKDLKSDEVHDIVAFLKSLTGKRPPQTPPRLPES